MAVASWLRGPLGGMFGWPLILPPGYYNGPAGSNSTAACVDGQLLAVPIVLGRATAIDRIEVAVSTLAASSTVRLGAYDSDGYGMPRSRLFDAGTAAATGTGVKSFTITQTLPQGVVWLVCVAQGGAPTIRTVVSGTGIALPAAAASYTTQRVAFGATGVTGALPAAFPTITSTEVSAPQILIRGV